MIRALGWPLVALWATWAVVVAVLASWDGGAVVLIRAIVVPLGIGLLLLAAFHRGRVTAFEEAAEIATDVKRARSSAPGNGGTS